MNIDFEDRRRLTPDSLKIAGLVEQLPFPPRSISPLVYEILTDPSVSRILSGCPDDDRYEFVYHTLLFDAVIRNAASNTSSSSLYGEEVTIPPTQKADGSNRLPATAPSINLNFLIDNRVDPDYVLIFRATQPSDTPKPESYWTTDYFETLKGLSAEMGPENRKNAVILVSTLGHIAQNGGLIRDINDDNGLAVRRVDIGNLDTTQCLAIINPSTS